MTSALFRPPLVPALLAAGCLGAAAAPAAAADWSDTALSWRAGSRYAEPYNGQDIRKNILALTYANGYRYGGNFLNIDYLMSDARDPERFGSTAGAEEAYVVYRHTLDIGKLRGEELRFGPVRGLGLTAGFDWNSKRDAGYNSRKQMLVLGPTLMFDVPGFLDASLLLLKESNRPSASAGAFDPGYPASRYSYKTHPMLSLAWSIPLGGRLAFEGYGNFIAAKGKDEVGNATAAETNIDMQLMYDLSHLLGAAPKTCKLGFEYQYWKNKFGNDHNGPAGRGAFARTPMLRAEYHF